MNSIELAIQEALSKSGDSKAANKAYLEFIKANFIIPIDIRSKPDQPEVLYLEEDNIFLPVFTSKEYLDTWAQEISGSIQILNLSGVNLLKGVGEHVIVCLNIGSNIYKEFNPAELARMKGMVLKLFK